MRLTLVVLLALGATPARADRYCGGVYAPAEAETQTAHQARIQTAASGGALVVPRLEPVPSAPTPGQDRFVFASDLHGSWPIFGALLASLDLIRPQYLALEVAEDDGQRELWERFNETPATSPAFPAIDRSVRTLLQGWEARFSSWASPYTRYRRTNWKSPMLELVRRAKERGIKIVPIDARDCYRFAAPLGHRSVLVRNYVWAKNIYALRGTTIVFGGRPHFASTLRDNVHDYVRELRQRSAMAPASVSFLDYASPEEVGYETEFVRKSYTDAGY